jgi:hypothetical protein
MYRLGSLDLTHHNLYRQFFELVKEDLISIKRKQKAEKASNALVQSELENFIQQYPTNIGRPF